MQMHKHTSQSVILLPGLIRIVHILYNAHKEERVVSNVLHALIVI